MNAPLVQVQRSGHALVATLQRAPVNAINDALLAELDAVLDLAEADDAVSVLHLRSAQKVFCAGADLELIRQSTATPQGRNRMVAIVQDMQRVFARLENAPCVTLAELGGACVGGGFELALACDMLLASPEARFADTHARIGVAPGWGLSQKLSRAIGIYRAREVSLSGNWVSAEQAAAWGFVNRVVPADALLDEARALARAMLGNLPEMLVRYKAVINDGFALSFGEGLALEKARAREFNAGVGPNAIEARREAVRARNRG